MIRKSAYSAILISVCIFTSCGGGGGSNGNSGDNNTSAAITAFGFTSANNSVLSTNITGVISGTDISVTVPYGTTSIENLVATFTTTGASVTIGTVEQTSGATANDFTSSKTYTVTGTDNSTQSYTVTVAVASNTAKAITAFSFPAVSFEDGPKLSNAFGTTISGNSITVKLPYNSTSMVAAFATSGASVTVGGVTQESGVTSNDFANPVTYTVTAADGSTQDYTVTVLFAPAVNSVHNIEDGGVLSTYWKAYTNTSNDADSMSLTFTCDAINAGSDNFTVLIQTDYGSLSPYWPGSPIGPYLKVPSDTTVTSVTGDYRCLEIVGPLTSIQSVIKQVVFIPPTFGSVDDEARITITDKNGLKARGRVYIYIKEADYSGL